MPQVLVVEWSGEVAGLPDVAAGALLEVVVAGVVGVGAGHDCDGLAWDMEVGRAGTAMRWMWLGMRQ